MPQTGRRRSICCSPVAYQRRLDVVGRDKDTFKRKGVTIHTQPKSAVILEVGPWLRDNLALVNGAQTFFEESRLYKTKTKTSNFPSCNSNRPYDRVFE